VSTRLTDAPATWWAGVKDKLKGTNGATMWGSYEEFIKDLKLNYENPTADNQAKSKLSVAHQGNNESITDFVAKVRKLNLEAKFEASRLWEILFFGVKEEIQQYMIRDMSIKGPYDSPGSVEACYSRVHSAGRYVEERGEQRILAQKKREALNLLDKKGTSGSGAGEGSKGRSK
jgi:hypothetical protein